MIQTRRKETSAFFFAAIGVLVFSVGYTLLFLYTNLFSWIIPYEHWTERRELLFFVSICVLSIPVSLVLYSIGLRTNVQVWIETVTQKSWLPKAIGVFISLVLASVFFFESYENYANEAFLPWQSRISYRVLVILAGAVLVWKYAWLCKKFPGRVSQKTAARIKYLSFLFAALLAAYSAYQPNVFHSFYSIHHFDAYFHSVYRVLQFQPYSDINGGMYGFYGILLAPVVKLLGGDAHACILAICMLSAICVLCYCYVLNHFGKSWQICLMGSILVLAGWTTFKGPYIQQYPHRILFCAISAAQLVYFQRHTLSKGMQTGLEFLISAIALLWNVESGAACILGFAVYELILDLQGTFQTREFLRAVVHRLLLVFASVAAAVAMANLYNIAAGGGLLNIKGLLFPYVHSNYVALLNISLMRYPAAWMLVVGSIVSCVCYGLYHTNLCRSTPSSPDAAVMISCTAMMAVQMLYYINRAVYVNLYIVFPSMIIMLVYLHQHMKTYMASAFSFACALAGELRKIVAAVLVLLTFFTVVKWCYAETCRPVFRNTTEYEEACAAFSAAVPEGTPCVGTGASVLYSSLGRDTGYYGLDFPDINFYTEEGTFSLAAFILETEDIVLSTDAKEFLERLSLWDTFLATHTAKDIVWDKTITFTYYTSP